ncbi:MAG: hypothetical protein RIR49_231 [Actinomycetota bacterium]
MRLSVDRTELELRPGSPARLTAEVHNTGDAAEMVGFSVDLPGTAWVTTGQPVVRVSRAETVFVSVDIHVGLDVVAGQHDLLLWVRSHLDPAVAVAQRIRVTVAPVPDARLVIAPSVVGGRTGAESSVTVANAGNTPLRMTLGTTDPAGEATGVVTPSVVDLPVGGSAEARLVVRAPARRVGIPIRRLVGVTASGESPTGPVVVEQFLTFHHRPTVRRAVVARAVPALAVLIVLLLLVLVRPGGGTEVGKLVAPGFSASVDGVAVGGLAGRVVAEGDGSAVVGARVAAQRLSGTATVVEIASVATDADGSFSFTALPAGSYRLVVGAPGFDERVIDPAGTVIPDTDLDIEAIGLSGRAARVSLPVEVADPAAVGSGEVSVTVVAVHDRDTSSVVGVALPIGGDRVDVVLSDLLAPAVHRVTISAPGHRERTLDVAVTAAGELDLPTVALTAEPASIAGRVIDTAAVPLGGVTVRATAGAVTVDTTTDAVTGEYRLTDLPTPATYVVEFVADGYAVQTVAVDVAAGEERLAVNGSLLGATGSLTGVVRDADGEPIGSARVVVRGEGSVTTTATLTGAAASGGPGSYRVSGLAVPGTYTVTVTAPGFLGQTRSVTFVVASADSELDLALTRSTGSVSGTVVAGGTPVGGATVRIDDGRSARTVTSASNPPGAFGFTSLEPGSYTVRVSLAGYDDRVHLVRVGAGSVSSVTTDLGSAR